MSDAKHIEGLMTQIIDSQVAMAEYMERVMKGLHVLHADLQEIAGNTEKTSVTRAPANGYAEAFETFWDAYPKHRRNYKPQAYKLWKQYKLNEAMLPAVLNALYADKKDAGWQQDSGKFVPGAVKWLQAKRWEGSITDGHARPQALDELDRIEAAFNTQA